MELAIRQVVRDGAAARTLRSLGWPCCLHHELFQRNVKPVCARDDAAGASDANLICDPAIEDAIHEIASVCCFARLGPDESTLDETTILKIRDLLEASDLADDILEDVNSLPARKRSRSSAAASWVATIIGGPAHEERRGRI